MVERALRPGDAHDRGGAADAGSERRAADAVGRRRDREPDDAPPDVGAPAAAVTAIAGPATPTARSADGAAGDATHRDRSGIRRRRTRRRRALREAPFERHVGRRHRGAPVVEARGHRRRVAARSRRRRDRRRRHRGAPGRATSRSRRRSSTSPPTPIRPRSPRVTTTLAPIADDLAHRAKRAVQDEQNDVLDGLRRQRGKIDVAKVLPAADEQLTRWAHVLQPSVDLAYAAGAASMPPAPGDGATAAVPGALLTELATTVVTPAPHPTRHVARVDRRQVAGRRRDRDRPAPRRPVPRVEGPGPRRRPRRRARARPSPGARTTRRPRVHSCAGWPRGSGSAPTATTTRSSRRVRGDDFPTGQPHPPAHPGVAASWSRDLTTWSLRRSVS